MALYDVVGALSGRQYIPKARGRMVKGYAMSGSGEPAGTNGGCLRKPPSEDEYVNIRRASKRCSALRKKLDRFGVPRDLSRGMTEEQLRDWMREIEAQEQALRERNEALSATS